MKCAAQNCQKNSGIKFAFVFTISQFMFYASLQYFDAILFMFTLLPIRFALALWLLISRSVKQAAALPPAKICDLIKGIIMISNVILLSHLDTSLLYHFSIKSQSVIKLYIFFNILEARVLLLRSLSPGRVEYCR